MFYGVGFTVPTGAASVKVSWDGESFNVPDSPEIVSGHFYEYLSVTANNVAIRTEKTWNYYIQYFNSENAQIGTTQKWEISRLIDLT